MPKKSAPTLQIPAQFAHLPTVVTNQRATLAERSRLAELQQKITEEITAFSQTGDVENLDALGVIVVKQAQNLLLPSRLAFLDKNLEEGDSELGKKFTELRTALKPVALEIRRGVVELYARRQAAEGIAVEAARRQGWEGLPKSKEVSQYEGFLDRRDDGSDYPASVSELLEKWGAWTGERDALVLELGSTIPVYTQFGLDAFKELPVVEPARLFYGKREVTPDEYSELLGEEGAIRALGWKLKSRASIMNRRGDSGGPEVGDLANRFLALVAGKGDDWTAEQSQAAHDDLAALEAQIGQKL